MPAFISAHPIISVLIGLPVLWIFGVLLFWYMRNWANRKRSMQMVFLKVMLPKKEGKEEKEAEGEQFGTSKDFIKNSGVMTQLLEALYAIISPKIIDKITGQNFFSFEYAVVDSRIYFYVTTPYYLQEIFEKQI